LGIGATNTAANQLMMGRATETVNIPSSSGSGLNMSNAAGGMIFNGGVKIGNNNTVASASTSASGISIGSGAEASGSSSIAIGTNTATASGLNTTAVGRGAQATGAAGATAVGGTAVASNIGSSAFGSSTTCSHQNSTVLGIGAVSSADNQVTIGISTDTVVISGVEISATAPTAGQVLQASSGTAASWQTIGGGGPSSITATLTAGNQIASGTAQPYFQDGLQIGSNNLGATASNVTAISIGGQSQATATNSIALGILATGLSSGAIGIGKSASANTGTSPIAIGETASSSGTYSLSIGYQAGANADGATALGAATLATGQNSTALGNSANNATYTNSVALGTGSTNTANNQIRLGRASETISVPGNLTVNGTATIDSNLTVEKVISAGGSAPTINGTTNLSLPSIAPGSRDHCGIFSAATSASGAFQIIIDFSQTTATANNVFVIGPYLDDSVSSQKIYVNSIDASQVIINGTSTGTSVGVHFMWMMMNVN
jgi:hypothetical protein